MNDAVEYQDADLLPRLTESLCSCLRWSRRDLDDMLDLQLRMLEHDPWANAQRASELAPSA